MNWFVFCGVLVSGCWQFEGCKQSLHGTFFVRTVLLFHSWLYLLHTAMLQNEWIHTWQKHRLHTNLDPNLNWQTQSGFWSPLGKQDYDLNRMQNKTSASYIMLHIDLWFSYVAGVYPDSLMLNTICVEIEDT